MLTLVMLGRIGLDGPDGLDFAPLLRQPKGLALLAYLASPRPGTWHRRDTLLAVFWAELDTVRGRAALRSALYSLRQHLGDGVLRNRGDDEVSLDPERFTTDAALLEGEVLAGQHAGALQRYGGELLPGLFVPEAEGFEKWLDAERIRLKGLARKAAVALTADRERAGDLSGAATSAGRAVELDPDDEAALRRWIGLLDRAGDRARALAGYEQFRSRLSTEFGAEPSEETVNLARTISARRGPDAPPRLPPGGQVASDLTLAPSSAIPSTPSLRRGGRFVAGTLGLVALLAFAASRWQPHDSLSDSSTKSLVVLPMENATGDPHAAYLATGLTEDIARRLREIGGLREVRYGARADWPVAASSDLTLLGREFGSEVALKTRLTRVGDSLIVTVDLLDLKTGHVRDVTRQRFTVTSLVSGESLIVAAIAGALFRAPIPAMPRAPAAPIDAESYRLTLAGWHALNHGDRIAAQRDFQDATARDPTNARAWAGLTSCLTVAALYSGARPTEEAYLLAEAAANRALALDSLQGTAWANLGMLRALNERKLDVGVALIQRGIHAEPANAELYLILSMLYRESWDWDKSLDAIRVARQLDPLSTNYAGKEASIALCTNRPEEGLRLLRSAVALDPTDVFSWAAMAVALARLGRFDEALEAMRQSPERRDSTVMSALAVARGEQGYWQVQELEGKQVLADSLTGETADASSRFWMGLDFLAAGEVDRGLTILEQEQRKGNPILVRLPCRSEVERWRTLPRYQALLVKVEALTLH
ncbi:MAG: BTAD domain-containing putative transcriptional regulator [Gemmatimonadota bacterium]